MDVIIPTNLVYVLFDPAILTSSFNFILFLYLYTCRNQGEGGGGGGQARLYCDCLDRCKYFSTDLPTTDSPTTDPPTTDLPTTDSPTTDPPTTNQPATPSMECTPATPLAEGTYAWQV